MRTTERYSWHNENPYNRNVGDCTVRAISTALGQDWDTTYIGLCLEGYLLKDMPSSNEVWRSYLSQYGLERRPAPPHTTVNEFARTHRSGVHLLGLNSMWSVLSTGRFWIHGILGKRKFCTTGKDDVIWPIHLTIRAISPCTTSRPCRTNWPSSVGSSSNLPCKDRKCRPYSPSKMGSPWFG